MNKKESVSERERKREGKKKKNFFENKKNLGIRGEEEAKEKGRDKKERLYKK